MILPTHQTVADHIPQRAISEIRKYGIFERIHAYCVLPLTFIGLIIFSGLLRHTRSPAQRPTINRKSLITSKVMLLAFLLSRMAMAIAATVGILYGTTPNIDGTRWFFYAGWLGALPAAFMILLIRHIGYRSDVVPDHTGTVHKNSTTRRIALIYTVLSVLTVIVLYLTSLIIVAHPGNEITSVLSVLPLLFITLVLNDLLTFALLVSVIYAWVTRSSRVPSKKDLTVLKASTWLMPFFFAREFLATWGLAAYHDKESSRLAKTFIITSLLMEFVIVLVYFSLTARPETLALDASASQNDSLWLGNPGMTGENARTGVVPSGMVEIVRGSSIHAGAKAASVEGASGIVDAQAPEINAGIEAAAPPAYGDGSQRDADESGPSTPVVAEAKPAIVDGGENVRFDV